MGYKDPEKQREYQRRWNEQHRGEYQRKYRETHARTDRGSNKEYRQRMRVVLRQKVFDLLGNICARCGFADQRALQIDHVNGGGNIERRALRSSEAMWRKILASGGEGYQVLCSNCNWIKRHENNECAGKDSPTASDSAVEPT